MSKPKLSILFVTAEVDPYATKAGLAQVAGSLPQAIKSLAHDDLGIDIRVIMPKYSNKELRNLEEVEPFHTVISRLRVPFGNQEFDVAVQRDDRYGVTTYLVDNDEFFGCDARIYWPPETPRPDCAIEIPNIKRFAFFSQAVLEIVKRLQFRPHVIHCNDWHTALILVYLWTLYGNDHFFRDPNSDPKKSHYTGSVFTLHNVGRGFQGIWPMDRKPDVLELAGLDAYKELYDPLHGLTHSARPHMGVTEINLFKGGIIYADRVNAVSPTYKEEILKDPVITGSEEWCGERYDYEDNLLAFLQHHQVKLSGIVNGIDYTFRDGEQPKGWDPEKDTCIAKTYTAVSVRKGRIPNKQECKKALQREIGLEENESKPLIGMFGRLEPQKGIALLLDDFRKGDDSLLKRLDIQLLIVGRPGEDKESQRMAQELQKYAERFSDWMNLRMEFVPEGFVHRLFAGCDMILMPSEYEPGGMPQMQGHRYGAIPVVRKTGGLADTVTDGADGFVFESGSWGTDQGKIQQASESMLKAIGRAVDMYKTDLKGWGDLICNAMSRDHTWITSAQQYLELYKQAQESARTRAP